MKSLKLEYAKKRHKLKQRIKEFRQFHKAKNEDIFSELCFCILTPQSKAIYCDKAIKDLKRSNLLLKGSFAAVRGKLNKVRFPNNKASYLLEARKLFSSDFKECLDIKDIKKTRDWLARRVKGLGYKEASHFLRNIGLGQDVAILDVHILRNLKKYKVLKAIPKHLSKKVYLDVERKMKKFSKKTKIPLEELDLLFWSNETGFVFK